MILASLDNRFYLGTDDNRWFISFDKHNQELFNLLAHEEKKIFLTTGPGSFVGTRSISSFALGYGFGKNISIYGFNLLLDILPHLHLNSKHAEERAFYIYGELERFFYCIEDRYVESKKFNLLTKNQVDELCLQYITCGNYEKCTYYYILNYFTVTEVINELWKKNKNLYLFNKIEYCGNFTD